MHIAITGGNGRIGRAVVELALAQGHSIVNIDFIHTLPSPHLEQTNVTTIQADLTDYDAAVPALHGCEALIHLAAIPSPGRQPDHVVHNNNVVANYNTLRAAAQLGIWRVCQASSINALGGAFSHWPRYDYFPLDEQHPTYNEDPYSLSKWIGEQQADSFARRYKAMTIASLRFHGVVPERPTATVAWQSTMREVVAKHLWGYTHLAAAARACLLALTANFTGHEPFYIVAPDTMMATPSLALKAQFYPTVPVRGDLSGQRGFFNCQKAGQLLHWQHAE